MLNTPRRTAKTTNNAFWKITTFESHRCYDIHCIVSLPTPQSVLHDADDLHQTPPTQQPSHYVYKDTSTTQYNRVHTVLIQWGWGMVWVNPLEIWIADHPEEARESDLSVSIDTCVAPSSYWTKLWKMVQNGVFSENKQLLAFYAMIVFKLAIPFWAVIYYSYEKKETSSSHELDCIREAKITKILYMVACTTYQMNK